MLVECKRCSATVDAKQIASYDDCGLFDSDGNMVEPVGRWTLVSCPRCTDPMLMMHCDIDYGFGPESPTRMYPPQDRQLGWKVPESIKNAFAEAVSCFKVKAFTASAIMCRKTLEGLCSEHGIETRNLSQSLKTLRDRQIIEARLFEWAEALRTLGNEAAHGVGNSISREDAQDTLDFTEALVQYVFTYQDQFNSFKARRDARRDPA